jgi:Rhodanese-like domain
MEAVWPGLVRTSCRVVLVLAVALCAKAAQAQNIHQATLGEPNQRTSEVSNEELRRILAERTATVVDARPFLEYAVSHIPGARNVAPKPGVPMLM